MSNRIGSAEETGVFLRLQAYLPLSYVNGPGARAVLWVQGCSLACPGCFNPSSHSFSGGEDIRIEEILSWLRENDDIEGLTISGGEPLMQAGAIATLLELVRAKTSLSVIVFTGFSFEEACQIPAFDRIKHCTDVLISGRYIDELRVGRGLIGSSNKTAHFFSERYSRTDLKATPEAEVIIDADGDVIISGIDPLLMT